jgi:hypothetical protein
MSNPGGEWRTITCILNTLPLFFLELPASFSGHAIDDALPPEIAVYIRGRAYALTDIGVVILLFAALLAVADVEFLADRHYLFIRMVFTFHSLTAHRIMNASPSDCF